MLAKCFPQRMRAMFGELKGLGGVIEVLPTIIEKSSFVFCFVFTYLFSRSSALDGNVKGWSDEVR